MLAQKMTFQIPEPYLPLSEYARRTGQTERAVRSDAEKGKLPLKERQKDREKMEVNMVALHYKAMKEAEALYG